MTYKGALVRWLSAGLLIAACGILLNGGGNLAGAQTFGIGAHRAKCYIVFMDETGSDIGDWNAMRDQAAKIAARMNSGDELTVIAINDRGGEAGNVRVPLQALHVSSILKTAELNRKREAIVQQVRSLTPQGRPRRTDIVGAIRQALQITNEALAMSRQLDQHTDVDIVLAFFSDMQQTPKMPKAAEMNGIHFPQGTKGYCFYVAAPGKNGIQSTVGIWRPLLNSAGIAITDNDFHQQGTVDFAIDTVFPPR
jgi:hypothetical protein